MKNIVFKFNGEQKNLLLDFNRPIVDCFDLINLDITDTMLVINEITGYVIDIKRSFKDNVLNNNDIILIKEINED